MRLAAESRQVMDMSTTYQVADRLGRTTGRETSGISDREPMEVNVIYTEPKATNGALNVAESLAEGLGAAIRLRAAISVPLRLGLDQCPVSIPFMEELLAGLVGERNGCEHTVHLYVCRDAMQTLLREMKPKSIVVVGGRRRWWPTATSRLERVLRTKGHRVVFVDLKEASQSGQPRNR
jgi:hypothetical protein